MKARVIGAGLAGCEAAFQLARFGVATELVDMKPDMMTPAHSSPLPAELVCSNSLKSDQPDTAAGLLKAELRQMGSRLLPVADAVRVPAGGALAVDRERFSFTVNEHLAAEPLIDRVTCVVTELPDDGIPTIVATGPLTDGALFESILRMTGADKLHFYDAVAPIVTSDSLDSTAFFRASRYGKGEADYLNCPLNESEYTAFRDALVRAERAPVHDFDHILFRDCQPIEELASRGADTMRYGPLRPIGLTDPATGNRPYACLQLRLENREGSMVSLVGCQTRLTFAEQRRVFGLIPALSDAVFLRYGVMHRNSYLTSPDVLGPGFCVKKRPNLYFAGQITGVEGYVESIATGLMAAQTLAGVLRGQTAAEQRLIMPAEDTMLGALWRYVTESSTKDFQPMNANFGLLPLPDGVKIKKKERGAYRFRRSREALIPTVKQIRKMAEGAGNDDDFE